MVVDKGFAAGSAAAVNRYFIGLVAVALVLAAATALRFYFVSKLGEGVTADLRKRLYAHVLTLDQGVFLDLRTGEVLSRLTTDTTIVETLVGAQASVALRNLLITLGALAMLVVVSPKLTLGVLVIAPLVVAPLLIFGRRVRGLSARAQDRFAEAVGFAGEHLDALDTVQAFGREASAAARFGEAIDTAFSASLARIRARAGMTALVIAWCSAGWPRVLWLGPTRWWRGPCPAAPWCSSSSWPSWAPARSAPWPRPGARCRRPPAPWSGSANCSPPGPRSRVRPIRSPCPSPPRGEIAFEDVTFA